MFSINWPLINYIYNNITNYVAKTFLFGGIQAFFIMILWNWIFPDIVTVVKTITYIQAFCLVLLLRLLLRGWINDGITELLIAQKQLQIAQYNLLTVWGNFAMGNKPAQEKPVESTQSDESSSEQ